MKRSNLTLVAVSAAMAVSLAACSSSSSSTSTTTQPTAPATTTTAASTQSIAGLPSLAACQQTVKTQTKTPGVLTAATDNPVYEPWFVNNTPSNGLGYESAVAYDVASLLGFPKEKVKWVTEGFDQSYAPGPKAFDFDINEISVTPERSAVVSFSDSYYDTTQSIVTLKGSKVATDHSPAALKTYLYGDQIGTTGLAYINNYIKPTQQPRVYNSLDQAVSALETHQIDAIVVDTPDGQYMASSQVKGGVQVGQFPTTGEHYGMLLAKGNPLTTCVNSALATMDQQGTIAALEKKYLGIYNAVPSIQP
jgi:polar amino acid transport system substrate-binding protein